MRIAFDISQTGASKAGCGYFAFAMINSLLDMDEGDEFLLLPAFGDFFFDQALQSWLPPLRGKSEYGPRHASLIEARDFWNTVDIESTLGNPSVIHSNNFWCPTGVKQGRLMYTLYDLGFMTQPAWTTETNRIGCYEGVFRASIAADWIVAISEQSKRHFLSVFPYFPEERIRVIYPCSRYTDASAVGTRPQSLGAIREGEYWLSVGTIEPRKNQRRLVEAFAEYLKAGGTVKTLVLAGGSGWLMEGFDRYVDLLGLGGNVVMTGYVSDEELIWLYRNCHANLYPSLFEGFGLPVLEGMQFGAPTVASSASSIPEVTGSAAIMVSPEDTEGWTQAMLRLQRPEARSEFALKARERAAVFEWRRSARALVSLYEEAVASPKREAGVAPAGAAPAVALCEGAA